MNDRNTIGTPLGPETVSHTVPGTAPESTSTNASSSDRVAVSSTTSLRLVASHSLTTMSPQQYPVERRAGDELALRRPRPLAGDRGHHVPQPRDPVHLELLRLPLHLHRRQRRRLDPADDLAIRVLRHDDLARARDVHQPRRDVHRISDRRVLQRARRADRPGDDIPRIDPDADPDRRLVLRRARPVELLEPLQ